MVCTKEDLASCPAFEGLDESLLKRLEMQCADLEFGDREVVVNEGSDSSVFVLLQGSVKASKSVDGFEHDIAVITSGRLFGTTGASLCIPSPLTYTSQGGCRVARIDVPTFYSLAEAAPQLLGKLHEEANALIEATQNHVRWVALPRAVVLGYKNCPECDRIRNFLSRNQLRHDFVDALLEADNSLAWIGDYPSEDQLPAIQFVDGHVLCRPTLRELADHLQLCTQPASNSYDCVVVGAGPSGLAAGVYAASEGLKTLVVEREAPGGQAQTSSRIENYLGFPHGLSGDDLAHRGLEQVRRLGAELVVARSVEQINSHDLTMQLDGGTVVKTKSIILAIGGTWRKLKADNVEEFVGRGITYGANHLHASLSYNQHVHLVGAGNSAGEAALDFAAYARQVTLLVRGSSLVGKMSAYLRDRLATATNINILYHREVTGVHGSAGLESLTLSNSEDGSSEDVTTNGLYLFLGEVNDATWLPEDLCVDDHGFILTGHDIPEDRLPAREWKPADKETSIPGIYCCGDVRSGSLKRVASAVGEGSTAVISALKRIQEMARA